MDLRARAELIHVGSHSVSVELQLLDGECLANLAVEVLPGGVATSGVSSVQPPLPSLKTNARGAIRQADETCRHKASGQSRLHEPKLRQLARE